jgi:CMP-N,N'-diacetyllegionaminic acid synthase
VIGTGISTLCLIPAKGCSTRLPRKNLLPLNGQSLIERAIEKAVAAQLFDEICVSTEDEEIAEVARNSGASVPFLRPENLSHDPSTITDVMLHALEFYVQEGRSFDTVFVMLPTAPFVTGDDLQTAASIYQPASHETLVSVTQAEFPPYNAFIIGQGANGGDVLEPCFPDSPYKYVKSTECPQAYRSNGAILITDSKLLLENRSYRELPVRPYVMPAERSLDIDTQLEYEFAQFLARNE